MAAQDLGSDAVDDGEGDRLAAVHEDGTGREHAWSVQAPGAGIRSGAWSLARSPQGR